MTSLVVVSFMEVSCVSWVVFYVLCIGECDLDLSSVWG